MSPIDGNTFGLDIVIPDSQEVQYHFTLGDGQCAETKPDGTPRSNRTLRAREGLVQYDTVVYWKMESVNRGRWLPQDVFVFQSQWIEKRLGLTYVDRISAENPVRQVRTIFELDSLIGVVQSEWRDISRWQYGGVLSEIQSVWYNNTAGMISDRALYFSAVDFLLDEYQLPAFFREYDDLRGAPTPSKATALLTTLITLQSGISEYWFAATDSVSSNEIPHLGGRHSRRKEQWAHLSAIFADVPVLADRFLSDPLLSDPQVRSSILQLKLEVERITPSWAIQDKIVTHHLDEAIAAFKSIPPQDVEYNRIGFILFEELLRAKRKREALDIADSLVSRSQNSLLANSFSDLYKRADSAVGPIRFERARARSASNAKPVFASSEDSKTPLSGRFLDLVSRDSIDLAKFKGKIVVLDFWATWCGPCISEIPEVKECANYLRHRSDLVFVQRQLFFPVNDNYFYRSVTPLT